MSHNCSLQQALAFPRACMRLGLRHIRIKPCRPTTDGKTERLIQTSLRECADALAYLAQGKDRPNCQPGCIEIMRHAQP